MNWEVRTMRSVTSCFNSTLYRKNLSRFWPIWALYSVIWLFALPLNLLTTIQRGQGKQPDHRVQGPDGPEAAEVFAVEGGIKA